MGQSVNVDDLKIVPALNKRLVQEADLVIVHLHLSLLVLGGGHSPRAGWADITNGEPW